MLAYPFDSTRPAPPCAEKRSPWLIDARKPVVFVTLPHAIEPAVAKLRSAIELLAILVRPDGRGA